MRQELEMLLLGHGVNFQVLQRNNQQPKKYEWSLNTTTQEDISYVYSVLLCSILIC
jgi:hypothetical protein